MNELEIAVVRAFLADPELDLRARDLELERIEVRSRSFTGIVQAVHPPESSCQSVERWVMLDRMSAETPKSPSIDNFEWGRISVAAYGSFKDVKLWPGGARAWDWDETGTRHEPGVQIADVEELLEHGAEVVVLSRGVHRRLQVQAETLAWLEARGVAVEVLQSEAAVARYNQLAASQKVGALIHSTC